MITMAKPESVTNRILDKLDAFDRQRRHRRSQHAVLWTCAVVLLVSAAAVLVDGLVGWWSVPVRVAISMIALLLTIACLAIGMRWAKRPDDAETLASVADDHTPVMQERMQTLVSSTRQLDCSSGVDRVMLQRVALETDDLIDQFDPHDASIEPNHRWPRIVMATSLVLWLAIFVWMGRDTWILVGRFLLPMSNWTRCQVEGIPGDQVAAQGESYILNLVGKRSTGDTMTLQRRFAKASLQESGSRTLTESIELVSVNRQFQFRQRRAEQSFDYRISTGDLQTRWYRVTVAPRPKIKNARLIVTPPDYTKRPAKEHSRMPNRLPVIEGSKVQLIATVDGDVELAMLLIENEPPRTMLATGNNEFQTTIRVNQETKVQLEVTEPHGLTNRKRPQSHFLIQPDSPPTVRIHSPSPDQRVRPDDTIELKFTARDDVGLARARLVVQIDDYDAVASAEGTPAEPSVLELIDLPVPQNANGGDAPVTKWSGKVKLDLSRYELQEGQTLSYRVEVFDTKQAEILQTLEAQDAIAETPETPSSNQGVNESSTEPAQSDSSQMASIPASSSRDSFSLPLIETELPVNPFGHPIGKFETISRAPQSPVSHPVLAQSEQTPGSFPAMDSKTNDFLESAPNPNSRSQRNSDRQNARNDSADQRLKDSPQSLANQSAGQQTSDAQVPPPSPTSSPPSPVNARKLDLPQPATSQSMRLRVSETVDTFVSQARQKAEAMIAQTFRDVESSLQSARKSLVSLLQSGKVDGDNTTWSAKRLRTVGDANRDLQNATLSIKNLIEKTKNTHYEFIGLQLAEIAHTHIIPAREDSKSALSTTDDSRLALVSAARQQTVRAIERLQSLYRTYRQAKRDFEVAEDIQQIEKLYRVYLEDAMAELARASQNGNGTPELKRTMAELDLDEDYLARLKEVLEMQRDLRAELAKILADDPRLMRRYFQNFGDNGRSIRDQLYDLAKKQREHADLGLDYHRSLASNQPTAITDVVNQHASQLAIEAMDLVERSLEIEETFETWLPLDGQETPAIKSARDAFLNVTASAGEVTAVFESNVAAGLFSNSGTASRGEIKSLLIEGANAMNGLTSAIDSASATLAELADGQPNLVGNATRRLVELTRVQAAAARWSTMARMIAEENFAGAVGIAQLETTNATHELTEKLTGLQQELARQLSPDGGTLPEPIAEACDGLLQSLDREIEPLQLASIGALRQSQWPRATERLRAAADGLDQACQLADELFNRVIKLLDELPPDPLADLLDDPTLDQILTQLEQERQLAELLGIPSRPTNLQVINDWANGKNGPGGAARARLIAMIRQSMNAQQRKLMDQISKTRKKLVARHQPQPNRATDHSEQQIRVFGWNVLRSQLAGGLLQESDGLPPETYRQSIDRYFQMISSLENEQ